MRRRLAGLAIALLAPVAALAQDQVRGPQSQPIVFAEPGFPAMDVEQILPLEGAREARTTAELATALTEGGVLVWRHGSTFPAEAWGDLKRFLESGGSMVVLGGEPFTRPAIATDHGREVQPRTLALLKALRLNQCHRVDVGAAQLKWAPVLNIQRMFGRTLPAGTWVSVLEPRLTASRDFPDEEGSPGTRDAVIRPLIFAIAPQDSARFPSATAAFAIDHLRGPWAGGQWVFWMASVPPSETELRILLQEAARPVSDLRVEPTYACFHEGERPSLIVRLHRPRATNKVSQPVQISIHAPDGSIAESKTITLEAVTHGRLVVPLDLPAKPGLYRVIAGAWNVRSATSGFWVFDPELFASGDALSFDSFTLLRDGKPEPVIGTTLMAGDVYRKFLTEPNPAVWDDTFAELAALNINLVRTGVWSGWRAISPEPGDIDEGWLRALEAYYLTARRHGIPVLFTFFAFTPERFGGDNPYFDPRALDGQRAFVSAIASRFAPAREILWDLINEPSFSSPDRLWKCRPHGDALEETAFRKWLLDRYKTENAVRARCRLAPDEAIGLPTDADFEDRNVFGDIHPYRAADYVRFAQYAFADWVTQMSAAIRAGGSSGAITVGQDEGGLIQRPGPLFHHDRVDFTSMHTWWFNDHLLWDTVMARAGGKPLLVSETGVMQRELLGGEAIRAPQDAANLLSRKIGYAFAGGAFGVVQWCYDVNPYMDSDNEVAIGLRRVDGSYKPEHRVLQEFAAFFARNRSRFQEHPRASPDVVLVAPTADAFTPRDLATRATHTAVAALAGDLGAAIRVVADDRVPQDLGRPGTIILPANCGIADESWRVIMHSVEHGGATLMCSGWFEADDAGLPARRLGVGRRPLAYVEPMPAAESTAAPPADRKIPTRVTFDRAVVESTFAAEGEAGIRVLRMGAGSVVHHALPLEWAETGEAAREFYRFVLGNSGWTGGETCTDESEPGVIRRGIVFRDTILYVVINETPREQIVAPHPGLGTWRMVVPPRVTRFALFPYEGKNFTDPNPMDWSHPEAVGKFP